MCGFAGLCQLSEYSSLSLEAVAQEMGAAVQHRGPDSDGIWIDRELSVAFAHRRLAILDGSTAGSQPMTSKSKRYTIAFNGEIYNHMDLRRELETEGFCERWSGHSDTETLLESIEKWGVKKALEKSVGMWAFALIDKKERILVLSRDRFGEKPLYWGFSGSNENRALLVGSELGAIRAYPGFNNRMNTDAELLYQRFGCIPSPLSVYEGVYKLEPGTYMTFLLPMKEGEESRKTYSYWSVGEVIRKGCADLITDEREVVERVEEVLMNAVDSQSISDVPLGTFLSGGIDSSLVSLLMKKKRGGDLKTFSIGFEDKEYDESQYARLVAREIGSDHTDHIFTSGDAMRLIDRLPEVYSEPFADSSQLPTLAVCHLARKGGLTVVMSGDGGDELFGGYNRYTWAPDVWAKVGWMPRFVRRVVGKGARVVPTQAWDGLGKSLSIQRMGQKIHRLGVRLSYVDSNDDLYETLVTEWEDMKGVSGTVIDRTGVKREIPECISNDKVSKMMAWDTMNYLPDDILVKVDRAAMSVGLETRAPFLDHRVAELAWRIPAKIKIKNKSGKWPLRELLYRDINREILERPKTGFGVPVGAWLRGPLSEWAEDLIYDSTLDSSVGITSEKIKKVWQEHKEGSCDHTNKIWQVVMWRDWLRRGS